MTEPLSSLVEISVATVAPTAAWAWAEGLSFQIPLRLVDGPLSQVIGKDGIAHFDEPQFRLPTTAVDSIRLRRAYTNQRPTSSRLPIPYQAIPPKLRSWVGSIIGKSKRRSVSSWGAFPSWPLDLSADLLADLCGERSSFAGSPTPVLLSHDIDSLEGLVNLQKHFIDIEESFGARSSNYIVPCAWQLDHGLLREIKDRGHEIGVHGYDHNNKTPFLPRPERIARLEAALDVIKQYEVIGYRAPSLLRTEDLIRDLAAYYRYDSSIPTSGGLFPIPNNGCATARPFWLHNLIEIPLSMPRDGSLRFLGHTPDEIVAIWKFCATRIAASGGVVVLLTHCEERFSGNPTMLGAYWQFLEWIANSAQFKWSTPSSVLERFLTQQSSQPCLAQIS